MSDKALEEFIHRNVRMKERARQALAGNPNDIATLCAISALYDSMGEYASARDIAERAIAANPRSPDAHIQHGVVCRHLGDFSAALQSFWRAVELRPLAARAYHEIAHLGGLADQPDALETLVGVFQGVRAEPERALLAGHAIAKLLEQRGDYRSSFAWLERAKQAGKAQALYSFTEDQRLHDAALELTPPGAGFHSDEPIFVVGLPRTGTTLVDRILASHRDVQSAGEISNWPVLINVLADCAPGSPPSPQTLRAAAAFDAKLLGKSYVESTRPLTGNRAHFTDKSPNNYLLAPLIHGALPNARIVCVRRNALDACIGMFKQALPPARYSFISDIRDCARRYLVFDRFVTRCRETLPPERFRELAYETLVTDFEPQARALVDFCGLAWDENCLRFHENDAPVATPSGLQVRSPIHAGAVGRWRNYEEELRPAREILIAGGICGSTLSGASP